MMNQLRDLKLRDLKAHAKHWNQPHHILLIVIILQGCFMIFMAIQGPSGLQTRARVAPHGREGELASRKGWRGKNRKSALSGQEDTWQKRLEEASKRTIPSLEVIKKQQQQLKHKPKVEAIPKSLHPPQYKDMVQVKEWEVSTQDFPGAIHLHLAQERLKPFFQNKKTNISKLPAKFRNKKWEMEENNAFKMLVKKDKALKSCYYYSDDATGQIMLKRECFNGNQPHFKGIVAYNSQPFPRKWCGRPIKPHTVQHFQRVCNMTETARVLLDSSDKLLGTQRKDLKNLPPVVFQRIGAPPNSATVEAVQDCDVPCKFTMDTCPDYATGKTLKGEPCLPEISDWVVEGADFKFKYSMKDPRDAPEVAISRKAYREHQYYATRSFQSEIPLSTFDWDRYGELKSTAKNNFDKAGKRGICFIHLEPCTGEVKPATWLSKLKEAFKGNFDSYGPCKYNALKLTETKLDLKNYKDRQSIMGQYMFTLVIGYSQTPDMISELVWDALASGSIPVYIGAPNIRDHVPPNSIIVGAEYPTKEAMALYLDEIVTSKEKWESLHAWRDDESTSPFEEKYAFLKEKSSSSFCRMCRWVLAAQYSLGWDPAKQALEPNAYDRKFCVTSKDVVNAPLNEIWMTNEGVQEPKGQKVCKETHAQQTFEFDEVLLTRSITSHDNGVVDMIITDIQSMRDNHQIVLRLDFTNGIWNPEGAHIPQPHQLVTNYEDKASDHIPLMSSVAIQDAKTRIIILTNWVTDIRVPKQEGRVNILIRDLRKFRGKMFGEPDKETGYYPRLPPDEFPRIRVIIEDVNRLRDVSTEFAVSPFARLMMADFLDPLLYFEVH